MTGWREASLDDLCDRITSGGTPSRTRSDYFCDPPDGHAWVKSQELVDRRITATSEHISDAGLRGSSAKELPVGAVLIAMYGANVGQLGYLGIKATVNQAICALIADPVVADPRFLYYALAHSRDDLVTKAHGAAQQNLSQQLIRPYRLRVPKLDVQRRIGAVLRAIDDLIENNRRRVEVLEEMARAIYCEWFVHFRYPGHENAAFVETPRGPIPAGWSVTQLAEVVSTQYGYTESASDVEVGPRYLRGMDINKRSYIDWSTVPFCPIGDADLARFRVEVGDVFVIRMADPGKVGICEVATNAVFASYLVRMRPSADRISTYLLFFTLCGEEYQSWVTGASTGATRKSVSAKVMTEPRIVLPPQQTQEAFEAMVRPLRSLMTRLVQASAALGAVRDSLLPKLVTGQIDVSSLDLDVLVKDSVA
ncbi:MAG: hypothetical protein DLM57_11215 [Pseudonocardiales bacterium]|nr:MAG: hypothetical protein DLM57_11215 [Pseudonocardiales bacterium]